jgi:NAD(P)H dehydrogenase (quinone)
VDVRRADYEDPAALAEALAGTDRLYFVSGSEVGRREAQHRNVVTAARDAGVELVVYTSAPRADTSTLSLAPEHHATEQALAESGLPHVVLRHNWYLANYDQQITQAAATGAVVGSAGEGRVWAASHQDFADAGVHVLTAANPPLGVHELGGTTSFTLAELAAEVGRQTGRTVTSTDLPADELVGVLEGAGLPPQVAQLLAGIDAAVAAGELDVPAPTLTEWLGHPTTRLSDHVKAVLAG